MINIEKKLSYIDGLRKEINSNLSNAKIDLDQASENGYRTFEHCVKSVRDRLTDAEMLMAELRKLIGPRDES